MQFAISLPTIFNMYGLGCTVMAKGGHLGLRSKGFDSTKPANRVNTCLDHLKLASWAQQYYQHSKPRLPLSNRLTALGEVHIPLPPRAVNIIHGEHVLSIQVVIDQMLSRCAF